MSTKCVIILILTYGCLGSHLFARDRSDIDEYLSWLDEQIKEEDAYDRMQAEKYDRQVYKEPSYENKDLLKDLYFNAILKTLQKRAESPDEKGECKERSATVKINATSVAMSVRFPAISVHKADQYMCTGEKVPFNGKQSFVVDYTPHASMNKAHHMLIYGCENAPTEPYWNCGMGTICPGGGRSHILWAWARNAPGLKFPKNVGYRIGGDSGINYIVTQIHYARTVENGETDCSGVTLHITTKPRKYIAGIFLMGSFAIYIPAHSKNVTADAACVDSLPSPITVFAFRTHTHKLGNVVTGMRYRNGEMKMIGKGNPKWPESFYPRVGGSIDINPGDALFARCIYSNPLDHDVYVGPTHNDEMCNFYMMYYTSDRSIPKRSTECWDIERSEEDFLRSVTLPASFNTLAPYPGYAGQDSINALKKGLAKKPKVPPTHIHGDMHMEDEDEEDMKEDGNEEVSAPQDLENALQEESHLLLEEDEDSHGIRDSTTEKMQVVPDWVKPGSQFIGQVGGLSLDDRGYLYVFHRGHRVWGNKSFNIRTNILNDQKNPIDEFTVLKFDPDTGVIVNKWGKGKFYMPHGCTVDSFDNLWLTDVGMHQVFRYPLDGAEEPELTLGEKFVPGNDVNHFCKPAATAVDMEGNLYVADGYCNGRVMKFTFHGEYITQWGRAPSTAQEMISPPPGVFSVVHSLAFTTLNKELWVVDRENGRIQCYDKNGNFLRIVEDKKNIGSKIFAISFSEKNGGLIHGVNGPFQQEIVEGFTIDYRTHQVVDKWGENQITHPHAIACFRDGSQMFVGQLTDTRILKFVPSSTAKTDETVSELDFLSKGAVNDAASDSSEEIAEKKSSQPDEQHEVPKEDDDVVVNSVVLPSEEGDASEAAPDFMRDREDDSSKNNAEANGDYNDVGIKSNTIDMKKETLAATNGPIIAIIAVLLILPTVIIITAFACVRMRQRRLKEYQGLLSTSSSASKFSDNGNQPKGKPSINLGKFFKKSEVDKTGFSRVRTEAESDEDEESDSDVELFRKKEDTTRRASE